VLTKLGSYELADIPCLSIKSQVTPLPEPEKKEKKNKKEKNANENR